MTQRRKADRPVNRLLDIVVEEVSLVDRAANEHRFLIVKRDTPMADHADTDTQEQGPQNSSTVLPAEATATDEGAPATTSDDPPEATAPDPLLATAVAALSFAVLFRVPPRDLLATLLSGVLAWGSAFAAARYFVPGPTAAFAGAVTVGLYANALARRTQRPAAQPAGTPSGTLHSTAVTGARLPHPAECAISPSRNRLIATAAAAKG